MAKDAKSQVYLWEGIDKQGAKVSGEVIATDPTLAKAELRQQGILPRKVRKRPEPLFASFRKAKIKSMDIAIFTRQLATMLSAGIAVVQALEILSRGTTNAKLQSLITSIKVDVESGVAFSDALQKHPNHFNSLFCNLVKAGEQSGSLDEMLARIATYREKTEAIKAKIKKALYYPAAVVIIAFLITAGLLIFVVPQFEEVFKSFGADLPVATRVVINLSEAFEKFWYIIFIGIGAGISLLVFFKKRSEKFAEAFDRFLLRLPIIGEILVKASIARFARTLAITFAAGLPLVDALQSVSGATGNIPFAKATLKIRDEVATGKQIQQCMRSSGLFPSMVVQMVGIGEESGSLEFMLTKIADFYEEEVDNAVDSLSSLLEPLIMVILGVIIGGLVVAMYLPIFKLGSVV